MNISNQRDALDDLRESAKRKYIRQHSGKTRVLVQHGHCSQSIHTTEIIEALTGYVDDSWYLVIGGCDGACYDAPRVVVTDSDDKTNVFGRVTPEKAIDILKNKSSHTSDDHDFFNIQKRIVLSDCGRISALDLEEYLMGGGYDGLVNALSIPPQAVSEIASKSGLLGRGGAYFPCGMKWESVRKGSGTRYIIVNAEEGEPGIFKDRHLMEGVPYRVIEGMTIAAYASGANQAFVYINGEADLSNTRIEAAIRSAYENGLLGERILGTDFDLEVSVLRGAGGYVCGEETTLLNTMEGYRREPRFKPPYPTDSGLWSLPTTVNNVETLANVPFILQNGAEAFTRIGNDRATGTKVVSLSGMVERSGVAEVEMGTSLREIVEVIGGGCVEGHRLKAVAVGGPSSGIFPPSMLDTPIAPGLLHKSGVMLGAGGIILIDEHLPVLNVVQKLAAYNAAESCGKCTPCREGTPRIVDTLEKLMNGGGKQAVEELRHLAEVVGLASLCGLGQAAGGPISSALEFFPNEFKAQ